MKPLPRKPKEHTLEKAIVPKAKAKAATKDTSKADHGGDNATEAGVAPKRKASNGVADSEAPKKRPAAKGHRSQDSSASNGR